MRSANAVDFWRGLALVMIFINHITGNWFGPLPLRNYAISDAAELFVFLAGWSLSYATGSPARAEPPKRTVFRLISRALELYRAQLVITVLALALLASMAITRSNPLFLEWHNAGSFFYDPTRTVGGIMLLTHQLGYFNILPLYIALMLWAPVAMILLRIHVALAAAVSIGIYALARADVLALPSWPEPGRWFFNPFAWQLLFTLGIFAGAFLSQMKRIPYWRPGFIGSMAVLGASFIVMMNGFGLAPNLLWGAFNTVDLVKSDLGLGRLVHFLALVYVVTQLRLGQALETTAIGAEMARLGRYSLPVFAFGSILSALGEVTMTLAAVKSSASPHVVGMVFTLFGILGLHLLARYLEWKKKGSTAPRPEQIGKSGLVPVSSGQLPQ